MSVKYLWGLPLFGCLCALCACSSAVIIDSLRMPKAMQAVFEKPLPPDVYCGVGVAQAEADGEAIFWAENRAREAIAQQLAAAVNAPSIEDDYDEADFSLEDFFMENFGEDAFGNSVTMEEGSPGGDTTPLPSETFAEKRTVARLYNSEVILREKDKNGNWWCMVWAPKDQSAPRKPVIYDRTADIIRVNAVELADMAAKRDFVRGGEAVTAFEKGTAIPRWVFDARALPENTAYGLGAARLSDDKAALQLATERARRSLTRSLDTEITSMWYTFDSYFTRPYEERNASFISRYDHIALPTSLIHYAKSKDGTWWVLLGCTIERARLPETIWEQFEEEIESYRGYQG